MSSLVFSPWSFCGVIWKGRVKLTADQWSLQVGLILLVYEVQRLAWCPRFASFLMCFFPQRKIYCCHLKAIHWALARYQNLCINEKKMIWIRSWVDLCILKVQQRIHWRIEFWMIQGSVLMNSRERVSLAWETRSSRTLRA